MKKEYLTTESAPAAVGPYSQAVKVGDFVFTAGQGGLDPATGKMVPGDVSAQAVQTMENLQAVLEAAGASFNDVIKTSIYLRYIKDFQAVNEVYAGYFSDQKPARTTIAASALPVKALVEIDMIALVPAAKASEQKPKGKPSRKKAGRKKKKKRAKKK